MGTKKFGTFTGVFIPSTEAILGTVLFLLMPLLTADVGFIPMIAVILLAHTVTIATAFSLSDCATNLNKIEGGGMYALSKRSRGNAMGGSIGIQLYLAQAASIGFYAIGFAAPLRTLIIPHLQMVPLFTGTSPQDVLLQKQIIATAFYLLFFVVVMIGADFTLKLQSLILVILFLSIMTIFLSPLIPMDYHGKKVFTHSFNLLGNRPLTLGVFFLTFTQFFPAVTGISTGVGMSGDLKNPKKSIVRGTFTAILVTLFVYIGIAVLFSFIDKKILITGYRGNVPVGVILTELFGLGKPFPWNLPGVLILLGVLFATASSALSVFMTGPRTAQYLAKDGILPKFFSFLQYDFKRGGSEPRYAVLVTFFVGVVIIWMGDINRAAVVVGILFLVVYGWVNGAAFLERVSRNPTFRPTFRGHWLISLYGFIACIVIISMFDWRIGIFVFLSQYLIFRLILKYKSEGKLEGVWWGFFFTLITRALSRLQTIALDSRNWRPIISAYAYRSGAWLQTALVAERIATFQGWAHLNILAYPVKEKDEEPPLNTGTLKIPSAVILASDLSKTIISLLQTSNPVGINPNTILLEYNAKVDTVSILDKILTMGKDILLFNGAEKLKEKERLDIWWRGERNGNLMVLLAYIMNRSLTDEGSTPYKVRVIRKLQQEEDINATRAEITSLLNKARLTGEIMILPQDDTPFTETLEEISASASLIMMGLPGNYIDNKKRMLFKLNEFFFTKEIKKYDNLPPTLFVRSARHIKLTED